MEEFVGDEIQFERAALYEEVWSDPVSTVSKRYGLSDSGLRKICKKLGVPLPEVGYWARVRAGQQIKRPKLRKHDGPSTVRAWPEAYTRRFALDPDEVRDRHDIEHDEGRAENRIIPIGGDVWRHELVRDLAKRLAEIDEQIEDDDRPRRQNDTWEPRFPRVSFRIRRPGGILDMGAGYAAVIVTPRTRQRALSIADAFFIAMEARGFRVTLENDNTVISWRDVAMRFRLTEVTEKTAKGAARGSWVALGRLRITLRSEQYDPSIPNEITAKDNSDSSLEDQLNDLAARFRLTTLGYEGRQRAKKVAERAANAEAITREYRLWHERTAAEAAQREKLAVESLFAEADQSEACERRRRYLERVELLARGRGIDVSDISQLGQWLAWARASCDALDPIFSRVSAR